MCIRDRVEAVLGQRSVVQCGHVLVHQVVDGIVPEGVLAAVSLDLCAVRFAPVSYTHLDVYKRQV